MQNFTNEPIDIAALPRYEAVNLNKLHSKYWKVILINILLVYTTITFSAVFGVIFIEELLDMALILGGLIVLLLFFTLFFAKISFNKRGFAFREHDVIFRNGIISTNTMVIPYNRVQHVAVHEGFISRFFGLAKVEIFTAGGNSSDIEIPGIAIEQAKNIKQLLMGKIQKQL
ncbi:PH domain-containing protein [Flavobacterium sp. RSB2_4_14]|uniref:PH domain-containing protein n=1 Tax=Flavobacterium sp. RSB2_4_14 TaxID=3447665 RepID=UPI003F383230